MKYFVADLAVMLFVDRKENNISIGVLYTQLFSFVPLVNTLSALSSSKNKMANLWRISLGTVGWELRQAPRNVPGRTGDLPL